MILIFEKFLRVKDSDTVAEWLRRWIANPLLFERVSSNLTGVDILPFAAVLHYQESMMISTTISFNLMSMTELRLETNQFDALRVHSTWVLISLRLQIQKWIEQNYGKREYV